MSDLTAVDALSRIIAGSLSNVYAIFSVVSISMLAVLIRHNPARPVRIGVYLFALAIWISAVGYALFPLTKSGPAETFQDIMHQYVVTFLVVILTIASLVLIIAGGFKYKGPNSALGIFACITLALMFVGAVGSGILAGKTGFGIVERLSTYSAVIFGSFLSIYGFNIRIAE